MITEAVNWIEDIRSAVKELYDMPNVLHPSPQELQPAAVDGLCVIKMIRSNELCR